MTKSLYKIQSEYKAIISTLDEFVSNGSDFEQIDIDGLNQALAINAEEFLSKADDYASIISQKRQHAAYLLSEAARLTEWANQEKAAANRLHEAISSAMQEQGLKQIDLDHFRLSFRKSEAVQISIDAKELPKEYQRIKIVYEPDKDKIKAALKSNQLINGAELITRQNLQIK